MAGIYIHVPFCKQACHYCNFYFSTSLGNKPRYLQALLKEIELSKDYLAGEPIETLYFGGGTPTSLEVSELKQIVEALQKHYDLSKLQEFTLEANPDDLTAAKVEELKQLLPYGLNRFSIGIQSFFEEDLRYMNRVHNAEEAPASIKRVQDAGFSNLTIDLIYGTPTMNNERWLQNLQQAFALQVPHISSYALTVEPKTGLENKIRKKMALPVNEEQSAQQFQLLMQQMQLAGYEQYEISNFAKPGAYAVHNTNYWRGKKYLGLGPSAHSFNGPARRWNVANNILYIEGLQKGVLPYEEEVLTPAQQINERLMTGLRTMWGVRMVDFGMPIFDLETNTTMPAAHLIERSLQEIDPAYYTYKDGVLTLTPQGKLFADGIAAQLFIEE
ncbi:MAG: radical SAM family heme chaperone HemW [Chitinophagales bacterium]